MRIYTVYKHQLRNPDKPEDLDWQSQQFAPEALLARYPSAARYGDYLLFAESLEQVTGTPALDIVDLAALGLQEDDAEGDAMTKSQLDAQINALMASEATGKEIQLSLSQGKHLYETIFKVESEEI